MDGAGYFHIPDLYAELARRASEELILMGVAVVPANGSPVTCGVAEGRMRSWEGAIADIARRYGNEPAAPKGRRELCALHCELLKEPELSLRFVGTVRYCSRWQIAGSVACHRSAELVSESSTGRLGS